MTPTMVAPNPFRRMAWLVAAVVLGVSLAGLLPAEGRVGRDPSGPVARPATPVLAGLARAGRTSPPSMAGMTRLLPAGLVGCWMAAALFGIRVRRARRARTWWRGSVGRRGPPRAGLVEPALP